MEKLLQILVWTLKALGAHDQRTKVYDCYPREGKMLYCLMTHYEEIGSSAWHASGSTEDLQKHVQGRFDAIVTQALSPQEIYIVDQIFKQTDLKFYAVLTTIELPQGTTTAADVIQIEIPLSANNQYRWFLKFKENFNFLERIRIPSRIMNNNETLEEFISLKVRLDNMRMRRDFNYNKFNIEEAELIHRAIKLLHLWYNKSEIVSDYLELGIRATSRKLRILKFAQHLPQIKRMGLREAEKTISTWKDEMEGRCKGLATSSFSDSSHCLIEK
jgi:hypothetical protein